MIINCQNIKCSVDPGQFDGTAIMLLWGGFQVVDFPEFLAYVAVGLLPRDFVLVVIAGLDLLAASALDFEHAGDVDLMGLVALDF